MSEKLQPIGAVGTGCLNCPPRPARLNLNHWLSPGFGIVYIKRDGEAVRDDCAGREPFTGRTAERLARSDPDRDWRIEVHGPLGGVVYQRHGEREWHAVQRLEGFA